jgi:hypothetical protein
MAEVTKTILRRVGRTLEWFIVGQMARQMPPEDRLFLFYEVVSGQRDHDPRIERARANHGRGGYCIGDYTLVTVTREELQVVLDSPEWFARRIERCSPLASNEARCIVLEDGPAEPKIHIFNGRSARDVMPPSPSAGQQRR